MRSLTRIGKQPLKFSFEVYVCDVRGLPNDVRELAILWERSGKTSARTDNVATTSAGSSERTAMVVAKLRSAATLYRSARRATFDAKPSTIAVVDATSGVSSAQAVLGIADFDLAEHAELNADAPARSLQLRVPRAVRRGDAQPEMQLTIQVQVKSVWYQGDASASAREDDEMSAAGASSSAGSLASSALTHEALQALEASQRGAALPAKGVAKRAFSFERSARNAKESGNRIAELTQLAANAAGDAHQAESRLATIQFRLRNEVRDGPARSFASPHAHLSNASCRGSFDCLVAGANPDPEPNAQPTPTLTQPQPLRRSARASATCWSEGSRSRRPTSRRRPTTSNCSSSRTRSSASPPTTAVRSAAAAA